MRTCQRCNLTKPNLEFYKRKDYTDGLDIKCKDCFSLYRKGKTKVTDPAKIYKNKRRYLEKTYGITFEQYMEIVMDQRGVCAICETGPLNSPRPLAVDHCHKTGVIRGILCHFCNVGLGNFKDNTKNMQKAINYLVNNGRK